MSKSGDLADIRNYLYDQIELMYWWSLGLSLGAQVLSLIAIFINRSGFLVLMGLIAFIASIIVIILKELANGVLQKADKCRRLILYADALRTEISTADLATVRSWTNRIQLDRAPFIAPYYSSQLPPGPQRLVDIVGESAFFTEFLAGKVASYLLFILIFSSLVVMAILYYIASVSQLNSSTNDLELIAKGALFIVSSVIAGEIFLLWKKYSELHTGAKETFERCSNLRDKPTLSVEEAMQVVEDYHLGLIQSPPIPLKVYLFYRDQLNELYRDSYKINRN